MIRAPVSVDQTAVSNEWSKWLWPFRSRLTLDGPPSAVSTRVTAATSGRDGARLRQAAAAAREHAPSAAA